MVHLTLQISLKNKKQDLSSKWIEMGKAEHASVASFSLFAQRLLAIGAPPDLINEAFECAKEEIEHAKYCFTVASHYAGVQIQPQSYESHSVLITPDVQSIIKGTIHEGCIEETLSALRSALDYHEEKDDYIKQVHYNITKDEAHHAAFAWKVFKWGIKCYSSFSDYFFNEFDRYLEKKSDHEEDIILLAELKKVLKGCPTSDVLKSCLEREDERYCLYSKVINEIYEVIKD